MKHLKIWIAKDQVFLHNSASVHLTMLVLGKMML